MLTVGRKVEVTESVPNDLGWAEGDIGVVMDRTDLGNGAVAYLLSRVTGNAIAPFVFYHDEITPLDVEL